MKQRLIDIISDENQDRQKACESFVLSQAFCALFFGINTDCEFVDQRQIFAEFTTDNGGQNRENQSGPIESDNHRGCHNTPAVLQPKGNIGNDERMCKIGKIGMLAQNMEQCIQALRIILIGKDGKEEQARSDGVEDTPGAQLMCRVNGL